MEKENLSEGKDETGPEERSQLRRAKRGSGRSSTLRRKTAVSAKTPGQAGKEKKETEEREKPAPQVKKRKRTASKGVAMKKKPARKKSEASPDKKEWEPSADEEEFELRSLPDGTLFRAKVEKKKKAKSKSAARRKQKSGDSGPGPAIVDLISVDELTGHGQPKTIGLGSIVKTTKRSCAYLKKRLPISPKVAVILGSGLSSIAELVSDNSPIEMGSVPGFVSPLAEGQSGLIRSGTLEGTPALFAEGRAHFYETGSMADTVYAVQTFMALGVNRLILTTAAGAINPDYNVGDIMFVEDHINLMGDNPLIGLDPKEDSGVFVDTDNIYHKGVLSVAERLCRRARVSFHRGTLAGVAGPFHETGAERRMLRTLGADAVSTSIIPEAISAAQVGVSVVALAVITRKGAVKTTASKSSDAIITGKRVATGLKRLITSVVGKDW